MRDLSLDHERITTLCFVEETHSIKNPGLYTWDAPRWIQVEAILSAVPRSQVRLSTSHVKALPVS